MQNKLIDLTHVLNEKITVYPDTVAPKFEMLNTVAEHGFAELQMTTGSSQATFGKSQPTFRKCQENFRIRQPNFKSGYRSIINKRQLEIRNREFLLSSMY